MLLLMLPPTAEESKKMFEISIENFILIDRLKETKQAANYRVYDLGGRPISISQIIDEEYENLFDYIFSSDNLREKNKKVFLFLDKYYNNKEVIRRFLTDSALNDVDASILKSALVMVNNISGLDKEVKGLEAIYNAK
jgi:hypothetical protein